MFFPWVTPGPSFYFYLLCHFFPPFLLSILFSANLRSVTLLAVSLVSLRSPVLYLLYVYTLQPQRPDLLLLPREERCFCLSPAAVTWRHAGGDSTSEEPAVLAALPHQHASCVLGMN